MKQKRWIATVAATVILCGGSVNSAFALSQTSMQTVQEIQIQPYYDYISEISVKDADGSYGSEEFKVKWDAKVNIWFENFGEEDVHVELIQKKAFGQKEVINSMKVSPDKTGGAHFTARLKKGKTYYVNLYTDLGNEIDGKLKVRDPEND